jgi:hypothetical protein
VNAKRAVVLKAQEACEKVVMSFQKECKTYETAKATFEKYRDSICSDAYTYYDEDNRKKNRKITDEQRKKAFIECGFAGGVR